MDHPTRFCRFEGFEVDTLRRELRDAAGTLVPLTSKAFDVLLVLIERRHEVTAREDLIAAAWPGRVVEENNLTQAIAALRRAFGAEAGGRDHRFIVTVPGRGYRFVAEVECEDVTTVVPAAPVPSRRLDRSRIAWMVLAVLAVALAAAWLWRAPTPPPTTPRPAVVAMPASLAVLPFRGAAGSVRDADLAALGLADALVTWLSRAENLRVSSMASVQRLGDAVVDAQAAGRTLGVAYVLDGTYRSAPGGVRVQARLQAVADGRVLWSGEFDAPQDRLHALQAQLGNAVLAALSLPQPVAVARVPAACEGGDVQAYRALLRAQYHLQHRDMGTAQAFQEAIRLDPACAKAYAGLATAYLFMAHNDSRPDDVFPLARAAALQALRLDPDSAEAWIAHGRELQLGAWDWTRAEAALRRAIAINPSLAEAHFGLAHLLVATGRFKEGLAEGQRARELDPLSPLINALDAGFLDAAGQPESAQAQLRRTLVLAPGFWVALLIRGSMELDAGDRVAAVRDIEAAVEHSGRASQALAVLARAYVAAGQRDKAVALYHELRQRAASGYVPPSSLAAIADALGDRATALDELERAERARDIRLIFLGIDSRWNDLRAEPRFRVLARRLKLSDAPARGHY